MLTLPDFKEKKIIIISNRSNFPNNLKLLNNNLRLYRDEKFLNQITFHLIFCIFIIGDTTITTKVIKECQRRGISIFFLDDWLKNYAEIISAVRGNYYLHKRQYTIQDDEETFFAKELVENKIRNQIAVLSQYGYLPLNFEKTKIIQSIRTSSDSAELLGIEGRFAKLYFSSLFSEHEWLRRAPQTKEDVINLLLDIGYTFLFNYVDSLLNLFGFDTYKGVYHKLFFQRKSLTCDIMEPLRPLIDKQLKKSFNLKQIDEKDFSFKNGKFQFKTHEHRKKYTDIWFTLITDNKEAIYSYVLGYYRYFSNPEKYKYISFTMR